MREKEKRDNTSHLGGILYQILLLLSHEDEAVKTWCIGLSPAAVATTWREKGEKIWNFSRIRHSFYTHHVIPVGNWWWEQTLFDLIKNLLNFKGVPIKLEKQLKSKPKQILILDHKQM